VRFIYFFYLFTFDFITERMLTDSLVFGIDY